MYGSMLNLAGSVFGEVERLRHELDDVFGTAGMPTSIRSVAPGSFPAVNVGHTPTSVEIYAFAPGLDASKLELTIDRGVLTIAGERAPSRPAVAEGQRASVYGRERPHGAFKRAISLPDDADASQVHAHYAEGVLHVSIARNEAAQPRRITVQ